MAENEIRVFDDPDGDPFIKYVKSGNRWFRLNEAAMIEFEESLAYGTSFKEVITDIHEQFERQYSAIEAYTMQMFIDYFKKGGQL